MNNSEVFIHGFNHGGDDSTPVDETGLKIVMVPDGVFFKVTLGISLIANVLALASNMYYARMWPKDEWLVYVIAIYATNAGIELYDSTASCIIHWNVTYPPSSSEFMCKFWNVLTKIYLAPGWLTVAILLNFYLQEYSMRRPTLFAAKYCTLSASKIVVGIVYGVVFSIRIGLYGSIHSQGNEIWNRVFGAYRGLSFSFVGRNLYDGHSSANRLHLRDFGARPPLAARRRAICRCEGTSEDSRRSICDEPMLFCYNNNAFCNPVQSICLPFGHSGAPGV